MERALVCLLSSTRGHQIAFPSFKRHVLDELDADLALAIAIDENYDYSNPYWQHAKYRWTFAVVRDWGEAYDRAQQWLCRQKNIEPLDWRIMLDIKGIWQGGIKSADPQPSLSAMQPFCRWLLLRGLLRDDVLDRYDRFIISRSDFVWMCPHPPLSVLDNESIWIPNAEFHGGLPDRHLVVSRADVVNCLNIIEDIVLRPSDLYKELKRKSSWDNKSFMAHHKLPRPNGVVDWNSEQMLAGHMERKGLLSKIKLFPYVMYTGRAFNDKSATWSPGTYEPRAGHYIKYPTEYHFALAYATMIKSRKDWETGAWKHFIINPPAIPPLSITQKAYRVLAKAIKPPGRVASGARFLRRVLHTHLPRLKA
jgi:hypothetical protein